jgi:hypothetical protein
MLYPMKKPLTKIDANNTIIDSCTALLSVLDTADIKKPKLSEAIVTSSNVILK